MVPLAEGHSQNLPFYINAGKIFTSTKHLEKALNLRNLSPASPGKQEPVPLMTGMAILHVPTKENAREALAPFKYSCCQGWLQEPQPSSLLQLTLPDCNTVRCQPKPSISFSMVWHYRFVIFAFMPYLVQYDEDLHMLLLCNKHQTAVADAHIYLH